MHLAPKHNYTHGQHTQHTIPMHAFVHMQPCTTQTLAFAVALPLTVALLMLLMWHIQLSLTNKTSIEFQEVGLCACNCAP